MRGRELLPDRPVWATCFDSSENHPPKGADTECPVFLSTPFHLPYPSLSAGENNPQKHKNGAEERALNGGEAALRLGLALEPNSFCDID